MMEVYSIVLKLTVANVIKCYRFTVLKKTLIRVKHMENKIITRTLKMTGHLHIIFMLKVNVHYIINCKIIT